MSELDFTTSTNSGTVGTEVSFGNNSIVYGKDIQYYWDFGDSFLSNEKTTSHVYSKPGNYNVTLTAHYKPNTPGIQTDGATGFITLTTPAGYLASVMPRQLAVVSIYRLEAVTDIPVNGQIWSTSDNLAGYDKIGVHKTAAHAAQYSWTVGINPIGSALTTTASSTIALHGYWTDLAADTAGIASNSNAYTTDGYVVANLVAPPNDNILLGKDNAGTQFSKVVYGMFAVLDLTDLTLTSASVALLRDAIFNAKNSHAFDPDEIRNSILRFDSRITGYYWKMTEAQEGQSANNLAISRYKIEDASLDSAAGGTCSATGCLGASVCENSNYVTLQYTQTNAVQITSDNLLLPENQCCFAPFSVTCVGCTSGEGTRFFDGNLAYRVCKNVNCASSCEAEYGGSFDIKSDYTEDCPSCRECYLEDTELGRYYNLTITDCGVYITNYEPDNSCGTCLEEADYHCFTLNAENEDICTSVFEFDGKTFIVEGESGNCGPQSDCEDCWQEEIALNSFEDLPEELDDCSTPTETQEETTAITTSTSTETIWHNAPTDVTGIGTTTSTETTHEPDQYCSFNKPDVALLPSGSAVITFEERNKSGLTKISAKQISSSVSDKIIHRRELGKARLIKDSINSPPITVHLYDDTLTTDPANMRFGFKSGPLAGKIYQIASITKENSDPPYYILTLGEQDT